MEKVDVKNFCKSSVSFTTYSTSIGICNADDMF